MHRLLPLCHKPLDSASSNGDWIACEKLLTCPNPLWIRLRAGNHMWKIITCVRIFLSSANKANSKRCWRGWRRPYITNASWFRLNSLGAEYSGTNSHWQLDRPSPVYYPRQKTAMERFRCFRRPHRSEFVSGAMRLGTSKMVGILHKRGQRSEHPSSAAMPSRYSCFDICRSCRVISNMWTVP